MSWMVKFVAAVEAVSLWQSVQLQMKISTRPGPTMGWLSGSVKKGRRYLVVGLQRRVGLRRRNRWLLLPSQLTNRHGFGWRKRDMVHR